MILGEKSERRDQSSFFSREHQFLEILVKYATCIVSSRGLFSYQSMAVVINLP